MLYVLDSVRILLVPNMLSLKRLTPVFAWRRLLVRHPQVTGRLREELRSVVGDSEHPSHEQIRRMPYLRNVIKESKYSLRPRFKQLLIQNQVSASTHQCP